jgi:hypothetical protein
MFDVTMDTDRAAVHNALRTTGLGGVDDRPNRCRVHRPVLLCAQGRLPVDRGNVIDEVHAIGRPFDRVRVG